MVEYDESNREMIKVAVSGCHIAGYLMLFTNGYRFDPTGSQSLSSTYMRQIADKLDELNNHE